MKIILENILKVLLENRIEDAKKKLNPEIVDYFVENDPSGNNKYLDWLVKAMSHKPTIQSINDILGDGRRGVDNVKEFLITLVKKFHELLPYMVYVENGQRVGTTDLYQYKFTDSEMIHYLGNDLTNAKERKEEKDKQKDAKKNSDKIYEDNNWLVVRPNNWESSCVYGAGTKWCTTSKESSSHFKRETDRNFLIYVINKNKDSSDDHYKVAWQIPYTKKVSKYVTSTPGNPSVWTLNTDKIKLWDAEDTNIARSGVIGYDYLDTIPQSIKGKILKYMDFKMKEMYADIAYAENPYIQALVEHLGMNEESVDDIEEVTYTNYGMKIFTNVDDNTYCVATDSEVERAKIEWAENYINDIGAWEAMGDNIENYIELSDPEGIADDMTNSYMEDLSDDDIIYDGKRVDSVVKGMAEEWEINKAIYETNEEDIEEMISRIDDLTEEEEEELDELKKENEDLENFNNKLYRTIKDRLRDDYYNTYLDRIKNDPLDWLYEMGYYSKENGIEKSAIKSNIITVDEDELISDMARDLDYNYFSNTGNYYEQTIEGQNYYIFPTDY